LTLIGVLPNYDYFKFVIKNEALIGTIIIIIINRSLSVTLLFLRVFCFVLSEALMRDL